MSGNYQTLFNAAIKLSILLLVLPFFGVHPCWGGLLIPVGLRSLVLTGTALGLMITPLGVLYGDIARGIPQITQFLMVLSLVVFPLATTGWTATQMRLNPLTLLTSMPAPGSPASRPSSSRCGWWSGLGAMNGA